LITYDKLDKRDKEVLEKSQQVLRMSKLRELSARRGKSSDVNTVDKIQMAQQRLLEKQQSAEKQGILVKDMISEADHLRNLRLDKLMN